MKIFDIVAAALFAALMAAVWFVAPYPSASLASSAVKIEVAGGHGSGVHIGNGYILTAAHVVGDSLQADVATDKGAKVQATVLWANKTYDVALMRVEATDAQAKMPVMNAAQLACRTPRAGEAIEAFGNPSNIEFVSMRGFVAGEAREVGPWKSVFVADMTVIPGMSGGPVMSHNEVVGISVGVATLPMGFGASVLRMGYVVPASTICMLMGRSA